LAIRRNEVWEGFIYSLSTQSASQIEANKSQELVPTPAASQNNSAK